MKAIPREQLRELPASKRMTILIACCLYMVFVWSSVGAISAVMMPVLEQYDAIEFFSLTTVINSIGLPIMTPIGGKLSDIVGLKNILIFPPIAAAIALIVLPFMPSFWLFTIVQTLLSLMIGAYVTGPYVIVKFLTDEQNVPKYMGFIASAMALGTFLGPLLAGFFIDRGMLALSINITAILPIIGVLLIMFIMPQTKGNPDISFDGVGATLMPLTVVLFVFLFDRLPVVGWSHPIIYIGMPILLAMIAGFVYYESRRHNNGESPLIPVYLFKNVRFTALTFVGMVAFCYLTPLMSYSSAAAYQLMNADSQIVGLFPLPRTILTIILPAIVGVWAGKKQRNLWTSTVATALFVTIGFIPLMFISSSMPVWIFFFTFAMCGISEPFRSVSITPTAQQLLSPEELSAGTALVNFSNSLSAVISSSLATYLFGVTNDPVAGFRSVFSMLAIIGFAGVIVALFVLRPSKK